MATLGQRGRQEREQRQVAGSSGRRRQPARHPIPESIRYQVLKRDGSRCRVCGARQEEGAVLEVDHIIPVSRGGTNHPSNLQTLCRSCNRGKSNSI